MRKARIQLPWKAFTKPLQQLVDERLSVPSDLGSAVASKWEGLSGDTAGTRTNNGCWRDLDRHGKRVGAGGCAHAPAGANSGAGHPWQVPGHRQLDTGCGDQ